MADVERAARQQCERKDTGQWPADAAAGPPDYEQPDQSHSGAEEPSRLEQGERENLGGERGQKIEAAAIHVEIDEGEGSLVGEPRGEVGDQEIAVFGMGIVVPAQPVVAKGEKRDRGSDRDEDQRRLVATACGVCRCARRPEEQGRRRRLAAWLQGHGPIMTEFRAGVAAPALNPPPIRRYPWPSGPHTG